MIRGGAFCWMLLLSVLPACRRPPSTDATGQSAGAVLTDLDRAAILKTDSLFEMAANTGSRDSVAALYSEDATLMPPSEPASEGREAIRRYWARLMDQYNLRYALGTDELEGRGDLAYLRGHYTLTASPKAKGGTALSDRGKFVTVLERQADGSWRYAIDIYNSDLPAPR